MPFIDLEQEESWIPRSDKGSLKRLKWVYWLLKIAGFYLVTIILGAVTGLVKAEKL